MIVQNSFSINGSGNKPIYGDITFDNKGSLLPVIIFMHGFKGFKDWGAHNLVARYFAQNGYCYVKFNTSHSGVTASNPHDVTDLESFANNTISKELADLNAVIDLVEKTLDTSAGITLIGHSRGGGLSIIESASDVRIKKLITWSAISDFSSLWKKEQEDGWKQAGKIYVTNARTKEQMPLNKILLEDFEENKLLYNILAAARKINIPWLIIHGDEDVNVPFEKAQELANANPESKLIKIQQANHVYGATHPYEAQHLPGQLLKVCEKCLTFLND